MKKGMKVLVIVLAAFALVLCLASCNPNLMENHEDNNSGSRAPIALVSKSEDPLEWKLLRSDGTEMGKGTLGKGETVQIPDLPIGAYILHYENEEKGFSQNKIILPEEIEIEVGESLPQFSDISQVWSVASGSPTVDIQSLSYILYDNGTGKKVGIKFPIQTLTNQTEPKEEENPFVNENVIWKEDEENMFISTQNGDEFNLLTLTKTSQTAMKDEGGLIYHKHVGKTGSGIAGPWKPTFEIPQLTDSLNIILKMALEGESEMEDMIGPLANLADDVLHLPQLRITIDEDKKISALASIDLGKVNEFYGLSTELSLDCKVVNIDIESVLGKFDTELSQDGGILILSFNIDEENFPIPFERIDTPSDDNKGQPFGESRSLTLGDAINVVGNVPINKDNLPAILKDHMDKDSKTWGDFIMHMEETTKWTVLEDTSTGFLAEEGGFEGQVWYRVGDQLFSKDAKNIGFYEYEDKLEITGDHSWHIDNCSELLNGLATLEEGETLQINVDYSDYSETGKLALTLKKEANDLDWNDFVKLTLGEPLLNMGIVFDATGDVLLPLVGNIIPIPDEKEGELGEITFTYKFIDQDLVVNAKFDADAEIDEESEYAELANLLEGSSINLHIPLNSESTGIVPLTYDKKPIEIPFSTAE